MYMNSKKPPDKKYKTIKCPIQQIIKKEYIKDIYDACLRTHKLVIHTYQFLRLFILYQYKKQKDIITINEDVIKMAFKTLFRKSSGGPKPKRENLIIFNKFNKFLTKYQKLNYKEQIDGRNLSQILSYMATDMLTNIENNIKINFISYIKRFVNSFFRKINNEIIENTAKENKTKIRKELAKDLYEIKEDLINNTLLSNEKYHQWINLHRKNIFTFEIKNSLQFDINNDPQKYIKSMIYMCIELEKLGTKSFQFFPLRNNLTLKNVPLDSKSLIELLIKEDKNEYLLDIEGYKDIIWEKFFNLHDKIFKQKGYTFDYRISTDCYSVSIQFINNAFIESEKTKKLNMKNKKRIIKELTKDMNDKEKENYKNKLKEENKKKQYEFNLKIKEQKDKKKAEFKKLPKEEKEKIKIQIQQEKLEKKQVEFPYLEELNDKQLSDLKK
jgi:hypothetical protein